MINYIAEHLRSDCGRVVELSAKQSSIPHKGTRGRFRELLVTKLLAPWLPPFVGCGTGVIIDMDGKERKATQEDIVIYDASLVPPVFAAQSSEDGVFPVEGVLCRVEVKSRLTAASLKSALLAAAEIERLEPGKWSLQGWPPPQSYLFAFGSDLRGPKTNELDRYLDLCNDEGYTPSRFGVAPPIRGLCVVGRGTWMFGGHDMHHSGAWYVSNMIERYDEMLFFVGGLSNTCFQAHAFRQGRSLENSLELGIGPYVMRDAYKVCDKIGATRGRWQTTRVKEELRRAQER